MMDLYEAIEYANRLIVLNDKHADCVKALVDACEKYRSLYEGAEKRIQRYRDVAGRPDIQSMSLNKDVYTTVADIRRAYSEYKNSVDRDNCAILPFDEWLFDKSDDGKEHKDEQVQRN